MTFSVIIVAAGSGSRAGAGLAKQWRTLAGRVVLSWSVDAFAKAGAARTVLVLAAGDEALAADALSPTAVWESVAGGATRAASVRSGLARLADLPDEAIVLIHDAARPLVEDHHIRPLIAALDRADGAVPALAVADTLKREAGQSLETVSRDGLWRAQTPQAFRLGALRRAYAAWPSEAGEPTDDAAVIERAGGRVAITPGDPRLMKLTYPEDFEMAEALAARPMVVRVGQGFDAHRFGPGEAVTLCGVQIAHDRALIGHSDADAGLHALTDALLGTMGAGDIGDHFPPSDPQWRGVDSVVFFQHAVKLVNDAGGRIVNVDVTLICERPKIKPHRAAMRERLAGLLALPLDCVSVKATTTEQMGFTGREEGLAAQAIVSVQFPA
jgi:2-C-methyl-D-erythritol 4-phosphate cytidylyltransferase/2-C-methyl-D-erythritol 2,4-cyclodiphosphate synthase